MFRIAGVDFLNTGLSPFIQVDDMHRFRLMIKSPSLADFKKLLNMLSSELSTVAFTKQSGPGKPFYLHRYMTISSWQVLPCPIDSLYFAVVRLNGRDDLIHLFNAYRRKRSMPLLMYFYNEQTVLRLSPFYLDVISDDRYLIAELKSCFPYRVTEYDGVPAISEEEWGEE
ncbi:hypothetical protein [Macrococcus brunensis]|uniref:hypothetical protein n=1 Tax=Macrococcus brunensis TaxID=198483 RepID=UPI001EF138AB|nr:hypothetical protein [Macrococcus brunensis]ULG71387.1 hypothetical protein MGG12_08565 [Macrococcus brunensis]